MSGGAIEFVGSSAGNSGLKLLSGATSELGSGAFLSGAQVGKGITFVILAGGTAFGGTISASAIGIIESGGAVTSDGNGNPLLIKGGGTFSSSAPATPGQTYSFSQAPRSRLGSGASFGLPAATSCRHHRNGFERRGAALVAPRSAPARRSRL
jgi:hypothetical protein